MPTPRKSNPTPNGPTKKAPAKRTRAPKAENAGIATKRAQMRGEDTTTLDPYAPTVWGSENAQGALTDLVLPSGQMVLAQRPGPEGVMAAGLLDDLDVLSGILPSNGQKPTRNFDAKAVAKDPKMLVQGMKLVDRIVVHVVIKPELTPEPADPQDREVGKIYPSSVGLEDKMFIFNWAVGGTRDLATFRQQFSESVADVAPGEDVVDPSE